MENRGRTTEQNQIWKQTIKIKQVKLTETEMNTRNDRKADQPKRTKKKALRTWKPNYKPNTLSGLSHGHNDFLPSLWVKEQNSGVKRRQEEGEWNERENDRNAKSSVDNGKQLQSQQPTLQSSNLSPYSSLSSKSKHERRVHFHSHYKPEIYFNNMGTLLRACKL